MQNNKILNFTLLLLFFSFTLYAFFTPLNAFAQGGLVPCGGPAQDPCTPCFIFLLVQNLLNFVWKWIAIPLATLMLVYGGFLMIIPGIGGEKSAAALTKGKKVITNALVGIVIVFFAWLLIDTIIKLLADPTNIGSGKTAEILKVLGPWNEIKCALPTEIQYPD